MKAMVAETANNRSTKKFTTKMVNVTRSVTLYAMEQCTPDLAPKDCSLCLNKGIGQLETMKGARILMPSCHVRFETYTFYIGAVNYSLPLLPPPPVAANSTTNGRKGKRKLSTKGTIAIVIPLVVVFGIIIALGFCLAKKKARKFRGVPVGSGEDFATLESLQYDLVTLQTATNNFSEENKLGEGGFGGVYKGILTNGQVVAVKRLSKGSGQGDKEFKNEVLFVAKLQHRNLARLLGFCLDGEEKLLVYEYVANKSLDHFLFDSPNQEQFDWQRRYKIIGGIARGMLYLHQDSRVKVIHRDLKASNVLLDASMNPKVSDFGMARIFGIEQSQENTNRVVGTYGYMAPEYAMHGQFSDKSDVYSFGVVVLEIISGKKNTSFQESGYADDLLSYAWKLWRDGKPLEFVDPIIKDSCSSNEVLRCMLLGLLCVQDDMDDRPTMATALLMLDTHSVTPPMPKEPAYFVRSAREPDILLTDIASDQFTSKSANFSVNDISVTEVHPR